MDSRFCISYTCRGRNGNIHSYSFPGRRVKLSYMIVEVLKRRSSEKNTLNQAQLLQCLQSDYPHLSEEITEKKVRSALEKMIAQESTLPDKSKALRYTDARRKKQYWTGNSLSDTELKFLIDSVVYSNIINTQNARSLAKRIQGLSGKRLRNLRSCIHKGTEQ